MLAALAFANEKPEWT